MAWSNSYFLEISDWLFVSIYSIYCENLNHYEAYLMLDNDFESELSSERFKDFDQALAFALRLRDIYQEAQTKYEELVKEFSNN